MITIAFGVDGLSRSPSSGNRQRRNRQGLVHRLRKVGFFFGLLGCLAAGWTTGAQALTERECDAIGASEIASGWSPGGSNVERYEGFDARVELPRLAIVLPLAGNWEMKVHSGNMLAFRTRADLEAARGRMNMVLRAIEGLMLGMAPRDHCGLQKRETFDDIKERVVEAILHPIPVRVIGHDGGYAWSRTK